MSFLPLRQDPGVSFLHVYSEDENGVVTYQASVKKSEAVAADRKVQQLRKEGHFNAFWRTKPQPGAFY